MRLIGTAALRREAMGFGDVTLMMMVGTFLGWQACLITFFLAPFAGLLVGLGQFILRRDDEIPYVPYLCLAAATVVVAWAPIWSLGSRSFRGRATGAAGARRLPRPFGNHARDLANHQNGNFRHQGR